MSDKPILSLPPPLPPGPSSLHNLPVAVWAGKGRGGTRGGRRERGGSTRREGGQTSDSSPPSESRSQRAAAVDRRGARRGWRGGDERGEKREGGRGYQKRGGSDERLFSTLRVPVVRELQRQAGVVHLLVAEADLLVAVVAVQVVELGSQTKVFCCCFFGHVSHSEVVCKCPPSPQLRPLSLCVFVSTLYPRLSLSPSVLLCPCP